LCVHPHECARGISKKRPYRGSDGRTGTRSIPTGSHARHRAGIRKTCRSRGTRGACRAQPEFERQIAILSPHNDLPLCRALNGDGNAGLRATRTNRVRTSAGRSKQPQHATEGASRGSAAASSATGRRSAFRLGHCECQPTEPAWYRCRDSRDNSGRKQSRGHRLQRVVHGDVERAERLCDCPQPRYRRNASGASSSNRAPNTPARRPAYTKLSHRSFMGRQFITGRLPSLTAPRLLLLGSATLWLGRSAILRLAQTMVRRRLSEAYPLLVCMAPSFLGPHGPRRHRNICRPETHSRRTGPMVQHVCRMETRGDVRWKCLK
jgi:hypothetical protein